MSVHGSIAYAVAALTDVAVSGYHSVLWHVPGAGELLWPTNLSCSVGGLSDVQSATAQGQGAVLTLNLSPTLTVTGTYLI